MIYFKLLKISHLIISKLCQKSTLKRLNQQGEEGGHLVRAFSKTTGNPSPETRAVFEKLEAFRAALKEDQRNISFKEIGSDSTMTVAAVSEKAASPKIWARFFYHLSQTTTVQNVLEIGTNLGISGQYFLKGLASKKNSQFITLEGVKGLCEIANTRFTVLTAEQKFEVIHGLYDQTLINIVNKDILFDLVFIDGNHRYEATLKYFEMLKPKLSTGAMVIFDDIHWSRGMRRAWRDICRQKSIRFTVNFFKLGIAVYDPNHQGSSQADYQLFIST